MTEKPVDRTAPACGRCRFAEPMPPQAANLGAPRLFQCRRLPPQIIAAPGGLAPGGGAVSMQLHTVAPTVEAVFWCGEFEEKTGGANDARQN